MLDIVFLPQYNRNSFPLITIGGVFVSFNLMRLSFGSLLTEEAVNEVVSCNRVTQRYGLSLTAQQASALLETRYDALENTGRIELGGGILPKLIQVFCDSPYLDQNCYEDMLHELLELFYWCKNETLDKVRDDVLLAFMKKQFDTKANGSIELLQDILEQMAFGLRSGIFTQEG